MVYVSREECQYIQLSADNQEEAEDLALQAASEIVWDEPPHFEVLATEEEENGYQEIRKEGSGQEESNEG